MRRHGALLPLTLLNAIGGKRTYRRLREMRGRQFGSGSKALQAVRPLLGVKLPWSSLDRLHGFPFLAVVKLDHLH
jgi:hypothetical protein